MQSTALEIQRGKCELDPAVETPTHPHAICDQPFTANWTFGRPSLAVLLSSDIVLW